MKEYCSDPICLCHSLLIRTQKKKKAISTVSINGYCVISIALLLIASYKMSLIGLLACPLALVVKNTPANARDIREVGLIPGQEAPLEEGMGTHSSILAWRIPRTEEPRGLQSIGSQRVRHD